MYLVIVAVFLFTTLFFTSGHHLGTTGTIEEKENPMKNTLLDKGIITPSGEINKDKISLVAGAITQPFAEMVWVTTGGDMETINRLTDVLVSMNTPADRGKLFKIIKMLYGLMGLPFSEEAEPMDAAPDVLEYDKKNTFDIEKFLKRQRRPVIIKPDTVFDYYEIDAADLQEVTE